jgi:hypothetical protein
MKRVQNHKIKMERERDNKLKKKNNLTFWLFKLGRRLDLLIRMK